MNKTTFARSSSLNQWEYCQQSHFITYTLGHSQDTNVKTEIGSACHKVCELLAKLKLYYQENPDTKIVKCEDDALGYIEYSLDDMRRLREYSDREIDDINKTRINKSVYKYDVRLPYGHRRYGVEPVEDLIARSTKYYSEGSNWQKMDFKHATNYTWIVLDSDKGAFDPRRQKIVSPEKSFVFPIDKPWAVLEDGTRFAIKGTIDLVREIDEDTYEIVDYKGLPLETEIPTPSGWTTMGDLQVGDIVFDENGDRTTVTAKSQVKFKDCYRISFDDKSEVECDDEHLWKLFNGRVVSVTDLKIGEKISVCWSVDSDYEHILPFYLSNYRSIENIEKIEKKYTQCISVDSPTHTYLCTRHFIPTHNTGQRLDWGTNKVKDYDYLCKDPQLMLYYYAASKLFPNKNIIITIFFIRDGGPYTICFDKSDLIKVEEHLERYMLETNYTQLPLLRDPYQSDFQCNKLCHYYKNKWPGTNENMCKFIHNKILEEGIDSVVNNYSKEGFTIGHYEAPG